MNLSASGRCKLIMSANFIAEGHFQGGNLEKFAPSEETVWVCLKTDAIQLLVRLHDLNGHGLRFSISQAGHDLVVVCIEVRECLQ